MSSERGERRLILEHLYANRGLAVSMSFLDLMDGLHLLNLPLSPHNLRGHLEYLALKSYMTLTRRNDMPGFSRARLRGNENPDHIVTIRLLPKAVDFLEGNADPDPGVRD